MCHPNACGLQSPNLRDRFDFDFLFRNAASHQVEYKSIQCRTKLARRQRERRNIVLPLRRSAIHKYNVASHSKPGMVDRCGSRCTESIGGGHKGCRGQGSGLMQLNDGLVHAGREPEVVSVENEASHACTVYNRPATVLPG
jgi:hypothetical protein